MGRVGAAGPSRRQFLAGAAVVGAGLLPRPARARAGGPKVAIVGGGIAGLTCALKLADRGIESTVYEASGRVGGRMFSNSNYFAGGQIAEWGGELIDSGHQTVRRLAKRFGLPLDDMQAAQPAGSVDLFHFFGSYYPKAQAELDFAPVFEAVAADEAAAPFPTLYDAFTPAGLALDQMSIYDWIESRVPGGHDAPLGALLDAAYAIEYAADTSHQAALNLIYLLAFQPAEGELAIFGESDEKFRIRGGNQRLPERIADELGERVVSGHRLARLARTAGGRYRLDFERAASTVEITADYVVLALPFAVLRDVDTDKAGFDALKDLAIQTQGAGRSGKLNVQFDERVWRGAGPWPGAGNGSSYSDTGYQGTWESTRAQPGACGILTFFSGGSVADAMRSTSAFATASSAAVRDDVAQALAQTAPVYPGLAAQYNGRATQSLPHKSPFFKSSYAYYQPGQYTSFAGHEAARQGGVFFCGEHTSIEFQGFMEGGAAEGKRAARQLAKLIEGNAFVEAEGEEADAETVDAAEGEGAGLGAAGVGPLLAAPVVPCGEVAARPEGAPGARARRPRRRSGQSELARRAERSLNASP
ncbi:MAG: NAD(P)/FAD-dependent oxidoreductase [Polyangiaceae bacterium]|jgi:monoamine oxidase|nr:NAD(P)/FAD-dependent oxidoreductase [Polyangiaceae bacterium]